MSESYHMSRGSYDTYRGVKYFLWLRLSGKCAYEILASDDPAVPYFHSKFQYSSRVAAERAAKLRIGRELASEVLP